jgi:hypothetical protein
LLILSSFILLLNSINDKINQKSINKIRHLDVKLIFEIPIMINVSF